MGERMVVQGEPDAMFGQKIIAYVVLLLPKNGARAALFQTLRKLLPTYLIPQEIKICNDLPASPNGKLLCIQLERTSGIQLDGDSLDLKHYESVESIARLVESVRK
jgi:acyl-coenzyme A synthetase/AMP-(fatty) acid ligase